MHYIISASTDVGTVKVVNEDSVLIRRIMTPSGEAVLGAVCDGVGGLHSGEIASASVISAMDRWFSEQLPILYRGRFDERSVFQSWLELAQQMNTSIREYGARQGMKLGTTLAAFMIIDDTYYIINVGDSRVYELTDQVKVLTHDQTLVAKEVERGHLTPEEASRDPRGNIILQCIGESDCVLPEFVSGQAKSEAVYMACSDGFRHRVSEEEILRYLGPQNRTEEDLKNGQNQLLQLNIDRREKDNISVVSARTFMKESGND